MLRGGLAIMLALALAQVPTPTQRLGSITGQVMNGDGSPAVGMRVAAMLAGTGPEILSSLGLTDGAGRFRLANLLAGDYFIRAGTADFPTYYPGNPGLLGATRVTVRGGATSDSVNFTTVSVDAKVSGRLAAAMSLDSGIPLSVVLATDTGQTFEVSVSPDGSFAFPRVPPGTYNILTHPNLGLPARTVYVASAEVSGLELGGAFGLRVSGKVSGISNGTTQTRVLLQTPISGSPTFETTVAGDGTFAVPWVPPGEYALWTVPNLGTGARAIINVTDRDIANLELKGVSTSTPEANVRVSGRMVGTPAGPSPPTPNALPPVTNDVLNLLRQLPGFQIGFLPNGVNLIAAGPIPQGVALRPVNGLAATLMATTDPDMTFVFPEVPPGVYALTTSLVEAAPRLLEVNGQSISNIVLGNETATRGPVRISGSVRAPAGVARPPQVLISSPSMGLGYAATGVAPNGAFEFSVPAGASYLLQTLSAPTSTAAVAAGNADVSGVEIVIPKRYNVAGQFVMESGGRLPAGLAGAQVWAMGTGSRGVGPVVQPDGTFRLALAEGEYRLTLAALPLGYFVKTVSQGSANLLRTPFKVTGATSPELVLTLAATPAASIAGQSVKGRAEGISRGNARVRLNPISNAAGPSIEAAVRTDGGFEFPKVPSGTYMVRLVGTSQSLFPAAVTVGDLEISGLVVLARQ